MPTYKIEVVRTESRVIHLEVEGDDYKDACEGAYQKADDVFDDELFGQSDFGNPEPSIQLFLLDGKKREPLWWPDTYLLRPRTQRNPSLTQRNIMSERTITIIIDAKEGTAETETKGFRGGACKANQTVKVFKGALGEITDEHDTPEMRLPAVGVAQQQYMQS